MIGDNFTGTDAAADACETEAAAQTAGGLCRRM
jgi:hypothetical protein